MIINDELVEVIMSDEEKNVLEENEKTLVEENEKDDRKFPVYQETPSSYNDTTEDKEKSPFRKGVFAGITGTLAIILIICIVCYTVFNLRFGNNVLSVGEIQKLGVLDELLDEYYYKNVSHDDKVQGIYKGLLEGTGDKYTEYYTPEEYKDLMVELSGDYAGIGAVLQQDQDTGAFEIVSVYEGSSAEEAGLKTGDKLVSVDGHKTSEAKDFSKFISKYIRGEKGTVREIVYSRDGKENTVKVPLKEVIVPSVSYKMLDNNIGYIEITQFSDGTQKDFEKALQELKKQGMTKVVYDLRNNGGGMVDSVVAILDDILPEGKVVYTKDKNGHEEDYKSDAEKDLDIPAVILTSENTASSAEIFTGAMRDFKRATIIGTKTYGKGIVQTTLPLNDGSAIKITTSRYYTPSGECIHGKGIKPDIELEYKFLGTENDQYDVTLDNQIQKAIEVLNNN
jgi:carboxyl-terminal processing protease